MGHTVTEVICLFCKTLCKSSFCNRISSLGPVYECSVTKFLFNPKTDTDDPERIDQKFGMPIS